jgi:response regulator RpfG family c-di-GMP phosphodiesterase
VAETNLMREAATTESAAATSSDPQWAHEEAAPGQRPIEDVVAAGVLLDVSRLLGGLLGLARPALGTRTERVTRLVRQMTRALALDRPWEFEVAARLSQIGWLTVPTETHEAAWRGDPLPDDEWRAVASHPLVARDLLAEGRRVQHPACGDPARRRPRNDRATARAVCRARRGSRAAGQA